VGEERERGCKGKFKSVRERIIVSCLFHILDKGSGWEVCVREKESECEIERKRSRN
jgi:hypothetical protein